MNAIVGIVRYGARIGFQGDRNGQYISKNLTTADELPEILEQDVAEQESHDRLTKYASHSQLPSYFRASPLGFVDKPCGKKRRIHHLSHPPGDSIKDGIPANFGEITYLSVSEVMAIIQQLGPGTVMI